MHDWLYCYVMQWNHVDCLASHHKSELNWIGNSRQEAIIVLHHPSLVASFLRTRDMFNVMRCEWKGGQSSLGSNWGSLFGQQVFCNWAMSCRQPPTFTILFVCSTRWYIQHFSHTLGNHSLNDFFFTTGPTWAATTFVDPAAYQEILAQQIKMLQLQQQMVGTPSNVMFQQNPVFQQNPMFLQQMQQYMWLQQQYQQQHEQQTGVAELPSYPQQVSSYAIVGYCFSILLIFCFTWFEKIIFWFSL